MEKKVSGLQKKGHNITIIDISQNMLLDAKKKI